MPISAREKDGWRSCWSCWANFLPEGPQLFPEDMTTDQPERQVMAEILREKLLYCLDKEIPTAPPWRSPGSPSGTARSSTWRPPSSARRPATRASSSARGGAMLKKGVHPGPEGHGAVYGHQGLSPNLGEGQGELAGQPGGGPQIWATGRTTERLRSCACSQFPAWASVPSPQTKGGEERGLWHWIPKGLSHLSGQRSAPRGGGSQGAGDNR